MSFIVYAAGYATLLYVFWKLFKSVYNSIFPFVYAVPQNIQVLAGSRWAVVTGSTDGIGKAYAFELAKKGFHLVLISRNQAKLDDVAKELNTKYPEAEVRTIAFDFTNANLPEYEEKIFPRLSEIEVGILVNNVGLAYEYPERIHCLDGGLQRVTDIAVINTLPATVLSAFVLKQMAERKNGVIVNVSSSAGYFPLSYWAVYSSSKKYVTMLSEILRKEYEPLGVTVQAVCPMMVATKMSKIRKTSFFTPAPEEFARQAVRSIGLAGETAGCMAHQIQAEFLFNFLPARIFEYISTSSSLRTRCVVLKKKAAEAKQE